MITGSIEPELKLVATKEFSGLLPECEMISENTFHPRVLFLTASYISAGLCSSASFSLMKLCFPSIELDLVQDMGKCGYSKNNDVTNPTDTFVLSLNPNDFIHMSERIYHRNDKNMGKVTMTKQEKILISKSFQT